MIQNKNQRPPQEPEEEGPVEKDSNQQQYAGNKIVKALFEKQFLFIKDPKHFMVYLGVVGLVFLVFTIVTLVLTLQAVNLEVYYAEGRKCIGTDLQSPKCTVKFTVPNDMKGPVYLLYSVKNLYINHRRFVNSYSVDQLNGKVISVDVAKQFCGQYIYNKNIPQNVSWGGKPLNPDDVASLCGAKPQGFFNDSFAIYQKGQQIPIDSSNIYKGSTISAHRAPNSEATQWIDPEDQHFKLYMLDGSLLTKRRLWGVITNGLKAGQYELLATNNYQMSGMKIQKNIFLTTTTIMGGRQFFYPVMFGICTLMCFGFLIFMRIRFSDYGRLKDYDKRNR